MEIERLRSYKNFKLEVKDLVSFYKIVSPYLDSFKSKKVWDDPNIIKSSKTINEKLSFESKSNEFKVVELESNLPFISRELIYIRVISALEVFLVEAVKDVFKNASQLFIDDLDMRRKNENSSQKRIELNNAQILSLKSISELKNKLLVKETRPLSSGGYEDIVKYYKKRLTIDISGIHPGLRRMKYYHDTRHILVHRLGKADKQYKKNYNFKKTYIRISENELLKMIDDVYKYVEITAIKVSILINRETKPIIYKDFSGDRYKIEFYSKITESLNFLLPEYHFWCDDEIYYFNDLKSKINFKDGKYELEIWGDKRIIESYIKNLKRRLKTSQYFGESRIQYVKHPKEFDESIILAVSKAMPKKPWSKGIHKEVATSLGLSNNEISKIITILEDRGVF